MTAEKSGISQVSELARALTNRASKLAAYGK
jgi:hypothetical protein